MTVRWTFLVDAGYLFAAGSTSAFGERAERREIEWTPQSLIPALVDEAQELVADSRQLLRTHWYDDGTASRQPVGAHHQILEMQDVKLRLGRNGQKGVDGLIIHDLMVAAFRG